MTEPQALQSCPRVEGWPAFLSWDCADTLREALTLPMHLVRGDQESFRGGTVRLGWDGGHLLVSATLLDDYVVCDPDDGRPLYKLGDVFEIFFRDVAVEEYFEIHISPSGLSRAHRFASREDYRLLAKRQNVVDDYVLPHYSCDFLVRVEEGQWQVLGRFPWPGRPILDGQAIISFSRYDYTDLKEEAVLSSTSPHTIPRFHTQADWTRVVFDS